MTLQSPIKKGDWIEAKSEGDHIVGQATTDLTWGQSALLMVMIDLHTSLTINVNLYDVTVIHKNLIPYSQE